jgi:hypothetical protein
MSTLVTVLISAAVPAILRWIYARSAAGKAISADDSTVFPESKVVPAIRWSGLILFSAAASASWFYGRSLLATACFGVFTVVSFFARGDPITVNHEGISGASTWGRRASLPWSEVVSVVSNKRNGTTMIVGKNGAKVCHSGFHLDKARFEQEVKRRTGLPMKVIEPGVWKPRVYYR